jgi:CRISPR-associated endonuclease Cas1
MKSHRRNKVHNRDASSHRNLIAVENGWADRCAYWSNQVIPAKKIDRRRKAAAGPVIILAGYGARLFVDHGTLVVHDGLTHYPQQRKEWQFFQGEWRTPSRIVVIDAKGGLTFDALRWLAEQNVQLIHLNWRGEVIHVVGGTGYAIDRKRTEAQLAARENGIGLRLSQRLIAEKIANSIGTLREALPSSPEIERVLLKLDNEVTEIRRSPPKSISGLLGIEGRVAYTYFGAWRSVPLRWKGIGKRTIPDDWLNIGPRQSMAATKQTNRNRHASHPVNAMLNYAYGILRNHVHRRIIAVGLDPSIGYLHGNYGNKAALVYDLMEPIRPIADRAVLEFVQRHVFDPADFTLTKEGVCRLNPQLAQSVVRFVAANSRVAETVVEPIRLLSK